MGKIESIKMIHSSVELCMVKCQNYRYSCNLRSHMQHKCNNAKILLLAESRALPQALFLWNLTAV